MSAPIQYEVEEQKTIEIEEIADGKWKVRKINISIYRDAEAVLMEIQNYIKQKELEEKLNEEIR